MAVRNFSNAQTSFSASVQGVNKVKRLLKSATDATDFVYSHRRLERLLLRHHRERFDELGSGQNAQRGPDGHLWAPLADSTLLDHPNPNRILFRTGDLRLSVRVLRGLSAGPALQTSTGAKIEIGIPAGSKTAKYAISHQRGRQATDDYPRIPARPFLGIGKIQVAAVNNFIIRAFRDHQIQVIKRSR